MKLAPRAIVAAVAAICVLGLAMYGAAIFGAMTRHSSRYPLDVLSETADSIWASYKAGDEAALPTGDDVTYETTFTALRGRVFHIPIGDRGGEGGASTSVGDSVLLMTHDGRFFAGNAKVGFRQMKRIAAPEYGYQAFYDVTHRPPYSPVDQNYPGFRYNDITTFRTPTGAGLLMSYTHFDSERICYTSRIARYDFPDPDISVDALSISPEDWRILFDTEPCLPLAVPGPSIYAQEAGGRMAVDVASNTIYLASGNYDVISSDGVSVELREGELPLAQDPRNDYGKILAVDLDTGESRHVATGFRNPQGITLDKNGRLWTVEHGLEAGDELNLIQEGKNYGFPLAISGTPYAGHPDPGVKQIGRHDGFQEPVFAWLPSIGPGSLITVNGFHPNWDGDLLVGAMAGDEGHKLIHMRISGDRVVFAENIPVGRNVRHLHQHTDGSIVLWNGSNELVILTSGQLSDRALAAQSVIASLDAPDHVKAAVRAKLNDCLQCHSLDPGENTRGPSLAHVYGARAASSGFPAYSYALKSSGEKWTRERLIEFLRDPAATVPGTVMPNPGLSDDQVRAAMADVLAGLGGETR